MPKRAFIVVLLILATFASIALWLDRGDRFTPSDGGNSATAVHEVEVSPGAVYSAKFTDLQGNERTLGQWDRQLLIVNFWATWCGPCKEEIPSLVKLQSKFGASGVQFVGIAADSKVNVANFGQKIAINYPLFIDEAGAIQVSKRLGNRLGLLPHTVMFSPGGQIIFNKLGIINEGELSDIIAKNLPK